MIGRVAGLIVHRGGDHVVIDVRGVGYVVYVSDRTMAALPAVTEPQRSQGSALVTFCRQRARVGVTMVVSVLGGSDIGLEPPVRARGNACGGWPEGRQAD